MSSSESRPAARRQRTNSPSSHSTTNVPLLNQYKHALTRRRLLQTITGGLRIRSAPWYIHVIQLSLWTAPFVCALPFIIISSLSLWNPYYIALVYGSIQGISVLLLEVIGVLIRYRHSKSTDNVGIGDAQLDDEESTDFALGSCCTFETFDFIFARKRLHSLLLHPLASGLLSFCGCFILQPSIMLESLHIAGVVIVSIIGWYALSSAHYSLSVSPPQETANYRPTDPLDLRFLARPFYIVAVVAIFISTRLLVPMPAVVPYLQLLYTALCLLPLGWLIGFLPPLDALIPWIMEWGLTRIIGGSPMATDLRLTIMFVVSSISVVIVVLITNDILSILLATMFGFLLSLDVFTFIKSPLFLLSLFSDAMLIQSTHNQLANKTFISLYGWDCRTLSSIKTLAIHYTVAIIKGTTLLGTSLVIVYFTFTLSGSAEGLGIRITAGLVIGLFCLLQGSQMFQRIYLFGIFRNPLFPKQSENVLKFNKKRTLLRYFSIPGGYIQAFVSPLLMLSFVGFSLKTSNTLSLIPRVWCGIVAARILRKVWQNTSSAHFEVAVVATLHFIVPADNLWMSLGSGTQIIVIGIAAEILRDFFQKLWFAGTMFTNFVFIRKHRTYFPLTILIILGTLIFLPFILAVMFISSLFSSPLLPLFTLPIFLVSFPRTKRFWPSLINYASSYSKCQESVYYQQSETEIARVLHRSITSGAISATPGSYLLLRFEDRLCVITFLEHSYGHSVIVIKGLELQETSCHSIEATKIDGIFEDAYEPSSKSCPKFSFNTHFFNTLQPVDSEVIEVYSDAHNVLTGIIDQPSSLQRFPENLLKCLVWVFFHHFTEFAITSQKEAACDIKKGPQESNPQVTYSHSEHNFHGPRENITNNDSKDMWTKEASIRSVVKQESTKGEDTTSWNESITSFDDALSILSDKLKADNVVYNLDAVDSLPGLIPEDRPLGRSDPGNRQITTVIDNVDLSPDFNVIQSEVRPSSIPKSGITGIKHAVAEEINTSTQSGDIPLRWMQELPLKHSQLNELRSKFSTDWLEYLVNCNNENDLSAYLKEKLVNLVIMCLAIVDVGTSSRVCGRRMEVTKPFDIYEGFCGRFLYSTYSDWIVGDQLLYSLLLKAYRYAVKLMYDEVSLGEVEEFSELVDYLESYSSDYFMGLEDEEGWAESVVMQKPHLFALGRDSEKNVYTAHLLSLQPHIVHFGQLNPAAVHGIWSDLSFELLYLTNDDEERYSIQAHPTLLRNLTIQTADPPLGYHIYSSGILRTPSI